MKVTIRMNTFETNSSSTHSMVICDDAIWNKFKEGKLLFNCLSEENGFPEFVTIEYFEKHHAEIFAKCESSRHCPVTAEDVKKFIETKDFKGYSKKYPDATYARSENMFKDWCWDYEHNYGWTGMTFISIYACEDIDEYNECEKLERKPNQHDFNHFFG